MKILIADDDESVTDSEFQFKPALLRALAQMGIHGSEIEAVTKLQDTISALVDISRPIDIVFLDVFWPVAGDLGEHKKADAAKELLETALKRAETVVILLSANPSNLLEYFFDVSRAAYRPHSVLAKHQCHNVDILAGTLTAAFSQARRPLRAFAREISRVSTGGSLSSRSAVNEVIIQELICMTVPGLVSASYSIVSGGLSGTYLYLVEGKKTRPRGSTLISDAFILKVAQDRAELLNEQRAHAEFVRSFPTNRFARLASPAILSFGGWSALAFEIAPGSTAGAAGPRLFTESAWADVFSPELIQSYVKNGVERSTNVVEWLTSDGGLLHKSRWLRLVDEGRALGVSLALIDTLQRGPESLFDEDTRQTYHTLVHGDLHSRNVMLSDRDRAIWVDAASIREDGLWCEDLARFAVWCACGSIEVTCSINKGSRDVGAALSAAGGRRAKVGWPAALNARIRSTLDEFSQQFKEKKVAIDIAKDWALVTRVELLRAAYSVDMFPPAIRLAALNVAASMK